jgi:hypothetical protein
MSSISPCNFKTNRGAQQKWKESSVVAIGSKCSVMTVNKISFGWRNQTERLLKEHIVIDRKDTLAGSLPNSVMKFQVIFGDELKTVLLETQQEI